MRIGSLNEWGAWAKRGGLLWASLVLILLGLAVLCAFGASTTSIRLLGFSYEMVGLLAVLFEVGAAARKHKRAMLPARLMSYLRAVPFLPRLHVLVAASGSASISLTGYATVSTALPHDATVEQRLHALEQQAEQGQQQTGELRRRQDQEEKKRASDVAAERVAREQADEELRKALTQVELGGLDLALFGVVWIALGTALSGLTPELCRLLVRVGCAG